MKKLLFFFLPLLGVAQPVLENSYPAPDNQAGISVIRINAGYKYMISSYAPPGYVKLYNSDHSVFKNIGLNVPKEYSIFSIHVSDSLFNADHPVEVMVCMSRANYTTTPITYTSTTVIRSETGAPLFTINNCRSAIPMKFENGWKLLARIDTASTAFASKLNVYSLIGAMPPQTPTKPGDPTSIDEYVVNQGLGDPFPNPSAEKTIIPYSLPPNTIEAQIIIYSLSGQEIKRYQVDNTFNTLELNNSDLASGTYLYSMQAQGEQSSARKMIIIK